MSTKCYSDKPETDEDGPVKQVMRNVHIHVLILIINVLTYDNVNNLMMMMIMNGIIKVY